MKKKRSILFLVMAFIIVPSFINVPILHNGSALAEAQQYTCPMHPHYVADRPGSCPICGMDLVGLESDNDRDYHEEESTAQESKNKRAGITIAPETIQNMGVRTETAQMASFGTLVRSYGDVTENVRLQSDISGRVSGWVKDLKIKAEGDEVKKGDLLFTLDSPELISAQQDYISAVKTGIRGRISAAKRRLGSLGVQDKVINDIRKKGVAKSYIPFYATQDGIVSEINIREGSYIKPGMKIIQIQDYASVWIDVSIAEQDIPYIDETTKVSVSFSTLGIQAQDVKIDYIYPTIDRATRTGRVRLVLDNADKMIKPGAYADVEFETGVKRRLSIPSDAILKSKDGDFVVIALDRGRFQPQKILSGLHHKGRTEVLSGVNENDKIVISGQFLIDSESALRESFRKMKRMQITLADLQINDDQLAMIDHFIDAALYIHGEMIQGQAPNQKMIMPALTLGDHLIPVFRGTQLQFVLEDAERALTNGKDSLTDKQWLKTLNNLVNALEPWITQGRPQHYKTKNVVLYRDKSLNQYWIQIGDDAKNPYGEGIAVIIGNIAGGVNAQ